MVDGSYDITLETPAGEQAGRLELKQAADGSVSGALEATGKSLALSDGAVVAGDGGATRVSFTGALSVLFQKVPFTCTADIDAAGALTGSVATEFGDFKVLGQRV